LTCVYVCIHACSDASTYVYMCGCICVCMYIHIHNMGVYLYICMHDCIYMHIYVICTLYYKAKSLCICLFVCTFSPSSVLLTNCLTQAHSICIDCSDNFSSSIKHIFNLLSFVIQKLRVFKERTERFSVRIEKSKYMRPFFPLRH